jgi:hypothetical protein
MLLVGPMALWRECKIPFVTFVHSFVSFVSKHKGHQGGTKDTKMPYARASRRSAS